MLPMSLPTPREVYKAPRLRARSIVNTFGLGLAIFVLACLVQYLVNLEHPRPILHLLSNALLAPACLLCGAGVLSWAAADGFFDTVFLGFRHLRELRSLSWHKDDFRPGEHGVSQDLFSYRQERLAQGKCFPKWYLLWIGLVFLSLSILCACYG